LKEISWIEKDGLHYGSVTILIDGWGLPDIEEEIKKRELKKP
jgi:hypothetical protein